MKFLVILKISPHEVAMQQCTCVSRGVAAGRSAERKITGMQVQRDTVASTLRLTVEVELN